jgi:hypothetical protein
MRIAGLNNSSNNPQDAQNYAPAKASLKPVLSRIFCE